MPPTCHGPFAHCWFPPLLSLYDRNLLIESRRKCPFLIPGFIIPDERFTSRRRSHFIHASLLCTSSALSPLLRAHLFIYLFYLGRNQNKNLPDSFKSLPLSVSFISFIPLLPFFFFFQPAPAVIAASKRPVSSSCCLVS